MRRRWQQLLQRFLANMDCGGKAPINALECPDTVGALLEEDKARYFAWNLRVNVAVEAFWGVAIALSSTSTIVPVFLATLGTSERLIALVPAVTLVAFALLQLPSSYFTTRIQRKAGAVIGVHLPMVVSWGCVGLIAQTLALEQPKLAQGLLFVCLAVASLTGGIGVPMWADFLNRQTPAHKRGRFFGWTFAAGSLAGLIGGALAHYLLARSPFPQGFSWCFFIAAGAMFVGLLPYLLVREVESPPPRFPSVRVFQDHVREVLGRRRNLRRLALVRSLMEAGVMASAFYAVRALEAARLPESAAGIFVIIGTAAQAPSMLLAGYAGERYGFRWVLAVGGMCGAMATLIALIGGSAYSFYALFVFIGCTFGCDIVSTMNLVMEMSPEHDKTVYQAIYNTLLVPVRVAYPLLASWIVDRYSMTLVFQLALPLQIMGALAVLVAIKDGRGGGQSGDKGMVTLPCPILEDR
ncbi:MAG: MFS transporter [Candidatus Zipacnadales bacterium]